MTEIFGEFIGITQDVSTLIEQRRVSPGESKNQILRRELSRPLPASRPVPRPAAAPALSSDFFDFGQGAKVPMGERLFLFLSEDAKRNAKPDGVAEVRHEGLFVDGRRVDPSHGSVLHPAMQHFQRRHGHLNEKGELISLSAWRQWHVLRDRKWVQLLELKDPALAKRRGRTLRGRLTLADLDL